MFTSIPEDRWKWCSGIETDERKKMKLIGLIGGMSWESTMAYYRIINEEVKMRLGGWHSARILMFSVDFHEIEAHQRSNNWAAAGEILAESARSLEKGGADMILICTNTMHKIAAEVQAAVDIPLVHIADAVAEAVMEKKLAKVGLLGTRFTMEEDFLKGYLADKFDLTVVIPNEEERRLVHQVIYDELCLGNIRPKSKRSYVDIIDQMGKQGAQGVILGCTEIPLLVQQTDVSIPVFDSTAIHAKKAVDLAMD
jgi:aspartate racemase